MRKPWGIIRAPPTLKTWGALIIKVYNDTRKVIRNETKQNA